MEREAIVNKLTDVFRSVLNDEFLVLEDGLTANDVENWDSLSHMLLISETESVFKVKFRLKELNKMRNVGDLIHLIVKKV